MYGHFEPLFENQHLELLLLQKLKVQNSSANQDSYWFSRMNLRNAPSVKELSISETLFDFLPSLDWSNLDSLRLEMSHFAPSHLLTALSTACNVTHFSLILVSALQDDPRHSQVVVSLDRLVSCNIDFLGASGNPAHHPASGVSNDTAFRRFIAQIRTPRLQRLTLTVASFFADMELARQLFRRPDFDLQDFSALEYLVLYLNTINDADANLNPFISLLEDLPKLQQLLLGDISDYGNTIVIGSKFCITSLLVALQWPTAGPSSTPHRRRLCPKLAELHLYHVPVSLDVLDAMISSRMQLHLQAANSLIDTPTSAQDAAPFDKPIGYLKLFLVSVALARPHRSQRQWSRGACLKGPTRRQKGERRRCQHLWGSLEGLL